MKTLADSTELRTKRIRAYRAGHYQMRVPPVCTTLWNEEAWCNWVHFTDQGLTGYLRPNKTAHRAAQILA